MKLKTNYSKKLLKIALLKSKLYSSPFLEDLKVQNLNLERSLKVLRTIFTVVRSFHLKRKTILFLGLPEHLEGLVNTKTQHIAINAIEYSSSNIDNSNLSNSVKKDIYNTTKLSKISSVVCFNPRRQISEKFFITLEKVKVPLIYIGFKPTNFSSFTFTYGFSFYFQKDVNSLNFLNNICFMALNKLLNTPPPSRHFRQNFRYNKRFPRRYNRKKRTY